MLSGAFSLCEGRQVYRVCIDPNPFEDLPLRPRDAAKPSYIFASLFAGDSFRVKRGETDKLVSDPGFLATFIAIGCCEYTLEPLQGRPIFALAVADISDIIFAILDLARSETSGLLKGQTKFRRRVLIAAEG